MPTITEDEIWTIGAKARQAARTNSEWIAVAAKMAASLAVGAVDDLEMKSANCYANTPCHCDGGCSVAHRMVGADRTRSPQKLAGWTDVEVAHPVEGEVPT
jgi:hypothetical protein